MDRSRPLWEAYVIEGLADGRWAMLTKTHHATIDGASGVLLLGMLTDPAPDMPMPEHVDWVGEAVPSDRELLERTMRNLAANPVKGMRLSLRMVRNIAEAAGVDSVSAIASQARDALKSIALGGAIDTPEPVHRVRIPLSPAPPTPFNRAITPHRRFAMRSTALGNIKALKDATGCTVNDVVMAICAGALREYLLRHDALPEAPLRAMVPVSIRTGDEEDPWTNRVAGIIADLPTNCADPLERVRRCHEAMNEAKLQMDVLPAEDIAELAQVAPPLAATAAMRLQLAAAPRRSGQPADERGDLERARPATARSTSPGRKMTNYIPVSTIADDMGLNITVHSYLDRLDFGLIADRELVPDLWDLVDLHIDEIGVLFEATGAEWAEPQPAPSMRRGGRRRKKRPAKKTAPAKKAPARKTAAKKKSPAKKSRPAKKSPGRGSRRQDGRPPRSRDVPNLTAPVRPARLDGDGLRPATRRPPDTSHRARLDRREPRPTAKQLAEAGYVVPHWPKPWGVEADPIDQLIIDDELAKAGMLAARATHRHRLGGADDLPRRHARAARSATSRRSSAARRSGASCSRNPTPAPTSPTFPPGPSGMATSTSSTARRSGRAAPTTRSWAS